MLQPLIAVCEWMWGPRPLRARYPLPGPIGSYLIASMLWTRIPLSFGPWLVSYTAFWLLFLPIMACWSRPFATCTCLMFAIRVRVRRGGRIIIRGWSPGFGARHYIPNFACDLGDRLVYTYQPRRATPRVFMKATGKEIAATWEEF